MVPPMVSQWDEIERISKQMHDLMLASSSDLSGSSDAEKAWQKIALLDKQRAEKLEQYINAVDFDLVPEVYEKRLKKLLQMNQQLVHRCDVLKKTRAQAISKIGQQRHAVNAYHKVHSNQLL